MSDFKRGDRRDDGYIFYCLKKHPNGKTYNVFMSPLAHQMQIQRNKDWRTKNREKALKATREWKLKNLEKVKEHRNKWSEANPEKVKESQQKYKTKLNSLNKDRHK
jgi:Neuraminidase (sialidase)